MALRGRVVVGHRHDVIPDWILDVNDSAHPVVVLIHDVFAHYFEKSDLHDKIDQNQYKGEAHQGCHVSLRPPLLDGRHEQEIGIDAVLRGQQKVLPHR